MKRAEIASPTTVVAELPPGGRVHLWLKPHLPGQQARVDLTGAGFVTADNPEEFTFHSVEAGGSLRLAWDGVTTAVSAIYGFDPAAVLDRGIHPVHHADRNAPPDPAPLYHFIPPFGWMNDPNGFGRFGDRVHLFYQHYPHALRWNNMHWGHAVSEDFLHWRHLPVFLFPNAELSHEASGRGGAFSGSAIPADDGAIRVFFTEKMQGRRPDDQNQWATVTRDGVAADPPQVIIPARPEGLGLTQDFRDPFVFRGPDGRWKMLLGSRDAEGGVILLYDTADATGAGGWAFRGILYRENRFGMKAAECPCLVPLGDPGAPETRWALVFALLTSRCPETGRRNLTTATVGRFDGATFVREFEQELDFGTDAYAFQAFRDGDSTVAIAWLANWTDISEGRDYPSAMTLPRQLLLDGDALLTPPIPAVTGLRRAALDAPALSAGRAMDLGTGAAEIALDLSAPGTAFRIDLDHPDLDLAVEQTRAGLEIRFTAPDGRAAPRYLARGARATGLRIFLDRGSIEVFADGGRWVGTKRLPVTTPLRSARLWVAEGGLAAAQAWQLDL